MINQRRLEHLRYRDEILSQAERSLTEALGGMFEEGEELRVRRGNGSWTVTFVGVDSGIYAGQFRAESRNGVIHTFHFNQVVPEETKETIDITSSHGTITIDEMGYPVELNLDPLPAPDPGLSVLHSVEQFDVAEYVDTYGALPEGGQIDILDIGYWYPGGYEPAEPDFRKEVQESLKEADQ